MVAFWTSESAASGLRVVELAPAMGARTAAATKERREKGRRMAACTEGDAGG